jgi:hypothetical protein
MFIYPHTSNEVDAHCEEPPHKGYEDVLLYWQLELLKDAIDEYLRYW